MHRFIALLVVLALPSLAIAKPQIESSGKVPPASSYQTTLKFFQGDTADSPAVGISNSCTATATIAGSDVLSVYQVATADTAATSGTLVSTFTSSGSASFTASLPFAKALTTTATAGGSSLRVDCGPTSSGSSTAATTTYDNTDSGLAAVNVKTALDELAGGPPATTVDTTLTLYENSDYDGDTIQYVIDAGTDLVGSSTIMFDELGLTGERTVEALVDSQNMLTLAESYVPWKVGLAATNPSSWQWHPYTGTTLNHSGALVVPFGAGRLSARSLSVYNWGNNSAVAESCTYEVRYSDDVSSGGPYSVDPATLGADTGWNACPDTIESGASSTNTGGFGDSVLGAIGTRYTMPQSSCTCATEDCVMIVAIMDRDGVNLCTQSEDVYISLTVGQVVVP